MRKLIVVFILFNSACTEEIDIPYPRGKEQIVLNSLLHPDDKIQIALSKTLPYVDSSASFPIVNNAEVSIYEDNQYLGQAAFQDSLYVFDYLPKVGKKYSVEAKVPGFETLKASDVIPEQANVTICFEPDTDGRYFYTDGAIRNIYIDDEPDEENAYWIESLSTSPKWPCRFKKDSIFWNGTGYDTIEFDTLVCPDNQPLIFEETKGIYFQSFSAVPDRFNAFIDNTIGGVTVYQFYLRVDDSQHNGNLISFDIGGGVYDSFTKYQRIHHKLSYQIIVHNASQHYDRYLKSSIAYFLSRDVYSDEEISFKPFAEIVQTYSNIENGTGIFAAYNSTSLETGDFPCE